KGTEKLFATLPLDRTPALAERISGDTSVGHALAHCQALEALAGCDVPPRARWLRVVLLELERLYNHVADVGMIVNDTGFAFGHSHCFRIREELLRLNERVAGHRLLRGAVVPGGVTGPVERAPLPPLPAGGHAFGLVEAWRGPVWHWVLAEAPAKLARVKVVDPSFRNWAALEYAVLKNIVPDFPLCNKSFNLSYSGNDL